MIGLTAIWTIAVQLTTGALGWMVALILARLVHQRRAKHRAQERQAVEQGLVDIVRGVDAGEGLAPYVGRAALLATVLLEFLALVRGDDRERALQALRALGVDRALRDRLDHGAEAGRLACVDALAVFPGEATERALRRVAAKASPQLRLAALRSLWLSGAQVELKAVLADWKTGALRHSGLLDDFVRELICADATAGMAALGRADLTPPMRMTLIDGLGEAGDYAALEALAELAAGADEACRTAALHALGRLQHPAAAPAVRAALEAPAWRVRLAACEAAGGIGLTGLADALAERLGDEVWRVRFQAAGALAALGPAGRRALESAAAVSTGPAAAAAALALAEIAA